MTPYEQIDWQPFDDSMIEEHALLSRDVYGDVAVSQLEHLAWKFLGNPDGRAQVAAARDSRGITGRIVALPRVFEIGTRAFRAAYLVDLAVHPRSRSLRSLVTLAMAVSRLEGFDGVLVTPNPAGASVWRDLLKIPVIGALDVFVYPLRPLRLLERRLRTGRLRLLGRFDEVWQAAWAYRFRRDIGDLVWSSEIPEARELGDLLQQGEWSCWRGRRSVEFFRWRFLNTPVFRYEVSFLRRQGKVVGWGVTRDAEYKGYRCRFVVDVGFDKSVGGDDRVGAMRKLVRDAAGHDRELVLSLAMAGREKERGCVWRPLFRIPGRWAPQDAPVFFREVTAGLATELRDTGLELRLADLDMF